MAQACDNSVSSRHISRKAFRQMEVIVALFIWLGLFHFNTIAAAIAIYHLPSKTSVVVLVVLVTLVIIPVSESEFGIKVASFIARTASTYFPINMIYEDRQALDSNKAYIVALEPHHVFPISAVALSPLSGLFPLQKIRILGSSVLTYVPFVRHIWRWLSMAPATRKQFSNLLASGTSCVIVPGGLQESLLLEPSREVLFLKRRLGFVRLAVESNVPIIPVFSFGQKDVYSHWFPRSSFHTALSRKLMFAPMLIWGRWGTPIPHQKPMTLVVGKPIPVPDAGSVDAAVEKMHAEFIAAVENLYEQHKCGVGAYNIPLVVT
ncbi:unnamed protein product [Closterium sp. Yama58-4]|nr:unnamed protein product [Closterium sp. Yama58-4]